MVVLSNFWVKINNWCPRYSVSKLPEIIWTTKISHYVIIWIEPSVCHRFGPDLDCRQLNLSPRAYRPLDLVGMSAVLVWTNPWQTLRLYAFNKIISCEETFMKYEMTHFLFIANKVIALWRDINVILILRIPDSYDAKTTDKQTPWYIRLYHL